MNVLTEHPTKITGTIIAALGFIQGYPGLNKMMSETTYSWVMFVVGLIVVALGFWNTSKAENRTPPPISSHLAIGLFLLGVLVISVSGCTVSPTKPVQTACAQGATFEPKRCVKAIGDTYEIYQKQALAVVQDPGVPEEAKESIRKVDAEMTPPLVEMLRAARVYDQVKLEIAAGETEQEKLDIANRELLNWINIAEPILLRFIEAVGG